MGAQLGAKRQDEQVKEQEAPYGMDVEDARIGEELLEVAAHLARPRLCRRAQVDEQKPHHRPRTYLINDAVARPSRIAAHPLPDRVGAEHYVNIRVANELKSEIQAP